MTIKKSEINFIGKQFAYVMVNGALTEVKILRNTFKLILNKDSGMYEFNEYAIVTAKLPDKSIREFDLEEEFFYKTEKDFETYDNFYENRTAKDAVISSGLAIDSDEEDLLGFSPYTFVFDKEKGCPVRKYADGNFELYIDVDYSTKYENSFSKEKGMYRSYKDCLWSEDYTVQEKDGQTKTVKSARKRLVLTDEQKTLVENISKAIKAAKDAGVYIYHDVEDSALFAMNKSELEFEWDCGGYAEQNILTRRELIQLSEKIADSSHVYCDDVLICTVK